MDQIVVKTEVQSNGEILLYYVDENGDSQEGVLTTIENAHNESTLDSSSYILSNLEELDADEALETSVDDLPDSWSDDDVKRLLTFFNDNKTSFVSGLTQKRHLWAVACKTMLLGKNQDSCEEKLRELKEKYSEVCHFIKNGVYVEWPFLEMCHQAFHDDPMITTAFIDNNAQLSPPPEPKIAVLKQETIKPKDGILAIKQVNTIKSPDLNVERMLNLYLKYKENFRKEHWRRDLWDKIAEEMGEEDSEYLHKRFLNHKQHYINMLIRKKESNSTPITWPYMNLFDEIFGDDASFHKKHFNVDINPIENYIVPEHEWNNVQLIVLAKYCYDCHDEFEDKTIPNKFLWTEVGRLIDKKPESCETKYNCLLKEHLDKFILDNYSIANRKPIAIIFDCTLTKTVISELSKLEDSPQPLWNMDEVDDLVQFLYDKIELFKDPDIHFVCWAAVAHKLKKSLENCKKQWDQLVSLYKSLLEDKKENSELQIEWRYIELFDRIFDYGMDSNLMKGYNVATSNTQNTSEKITVKKINLIKKESQEDQTVSKDDPNYIAGNEPRTDPRSTKILEYYLKNKDKFQSRNKLTMWETLAQQIGLTTSQCAHRFKSLKQTYIDYVKVELNKSRVSISWPYYALCKKVFGYRTIKSKLKQGLEKGHNSEWLTREIKLLINYFSENFHDISNNIDDVNLWAPLSSQLGKSNIDCKEKFVELRKCYRKLKTRSRNTGVKISWSYFDMFDRIYRMREGDEDMEVEALDEQNMEVEQLDTEVLGAVEEVGAEDDYQCIIVLQEGQELPTDIGDAQILIQQKSNEDNPEIENNTEIISQTSNITENAYNRVLKTSTWTKRTIKRLLIYYINYIRLHKGQEIRGKKMWSEIASKLPNKKPVNCRRMFQKMKDNYAQMDETAKANNPYASLLNKVDKLKPRFIKADSKQQDKVYKDVPMDSQKVDQALAYYLEHIEEFVNPRFEEKYLWTQLANHITEPVNKIYNKINYLKQAYDIETEEIAGEVTEYSALLKEIISKEVAVKMVLDFDLRPEFNNEETNWSDEEIEQLMLWYLSNLDKFKNPKFNKSYLWIEASAILNKSPLACSKKMSEIRTLYRNMVKENCEGLKNWIFLELCQKIYGTGKKNLPYPVVQNNL